MDFIFKKFVSALFVARVSELARRSTAAAAILASFPVTSLLALTWLYRDIGRVDKVSELSMGIFWAVIPSLLFFIVLPLFLKQGVRFHWAISLSCLVLVLIYSGYVVVLRKWEVGI